MSCFRVSLLFACVALLGLAASETRAEEDPPSPSNLQLFQSLAGWMADSLVAQDAPAESASVVLIVNPQDTRWFLADVAERKFRERGWKVATAGTARYAADISLYDMKVTYGNPRRRGIFGARIADRNVAVHAHIRLSDLRDGTIVTDGERTADISDVVEMSMIETLENPSVPQTHGAYPPEGFFAGWAEPLVLLGAVAVAVYLLFTVRS
jgi:hypothetical protein